MSKAELLADLTAAREELYAVLRRVPEERRFLRAEGGGQCSWPAGADSVAGLCGHISAWESRLLTVIQQISQGDVARVADLSLLTPAQPLCDGSQPARRSFNLLAGRRRFRWPWHDLMTELVWIREETGATLAILPEGRLFQPFARANEPLLPPMGTIAQVFGFLAGHDRHHTGQIQRFLAEE